MSKGRKIKIVRRYSEALKRKVVEEFESGMSSAREAVDGYGIENIRTVYRWVSKYGRNKTQTKIVRVIMKDEKERIRELEGALAESTVKNRVFEEMLKVYEELHGGAIKKKFSTKQLKEYERLKKRLKSMGFNHFAELSE